MATKTESKPRLPGEKTKPQLPGEKTVRELALEMQALNPGMSMYEIAKRLGADPSYIWRILRAKPQTAPRVTVTCAHCGAEKRILQSKYDLDTANGKRFWFCSRACLGPGMVGRMPHPKPTQVNQMPSTLSRNASVAQLDAKYQAKGLHLCPDGQPHHWVLKELTVGGLYPGRCERCGAERGHGGGEPWA